MHVHEILFKPAGASSIKKGKMRSEERKPQEMQFTMVGIPIWSWKQTVLFQKQFQSWNNLNFFNLTRKNRCKSATVSLCFPHSAPLVSTIAAASVGDWGRGTWLSSRYWLKILRDPLEGIRKLLVGVSQIDYFNQFDL
jgi:hypothetical protein